MDATTDLRTKNVLHRAFRQTRPVETPEPIPPGLRTRAAEALALGLLGGWLETGVVLAHGAFVGTVTRITVSISRHHVALGMLAHLAIFAGWLAVAAAMRWAGLRGRRSDLAITGLGLFLAVASPLLALEELHWWSGLAMTVGLSARLTPRWRRFRGAISRRTLAPLGLATALVVGIGLVRDFSAERQALAALPPAPSGAPNVVLLVLDTVRADHLSLYGYSRPTTPHLADLAARSIVFDGARSPAPWTLPAHASMFTGRWPHELSVDYDRPLDGEFPTLAESFSARGYRTGGFVGNDFYCNGWFGVDRGFSRYEDAPENRDLSVQQTLRCAALTRMLMPVAVRFGIWPTTGQYPTHKPAEKVNQDALAWLDGSPGDRPFFLFLNYIDAHGPYIIPEEFPRTFTKLPTPRLREIFAAARRKGNDLRLGESERQASLTEMAREGIDAYDDCLRYIDEQIARLLAELDRRGVGRNTWIVISADHGEHFGEHGKYWHGNTLYREQVNVPLLIVPPGGTSGRRVAEPVSTRDLAATIADLAGPAWAWPFPGRSLRRFWDPSGPASGPPEPPISELKLTAEQIRAHGLKPSESYRIAILDHGQIYHRDPIGAEELYDAGDQAEATDLAKNADLSPFRDLLERFQGNDRAEPPSAP